MKRLEKSYTIGDYWVDFSISKYNPLLDVLLSRCKHVCVNGKYPYWYFRFSILKFNVEIHPSLF